MKKINVAIITGGVGLEHEISLQSGLAIFKNLNRNKYEVQLYDTGSDLPEIVKNKDKIDLAFLATRGKGGEDGSLQGFLELLNIKYTGSGIRACANCIDKISAKRIFCHAKVATPDFTFIAKRDGIQPAKILKEVSLPCVVKPARGGNKEAVCVVRDEKILEKSIRQAKKTDEYILIEQYIQGREFAVLVMGDNLPEIVSIYESNILLENQNITKKIEKIVAKEAINAYLALGCRGCAQVDLILDKNENPFILEINTVPNMALGSAFACSLAKSKIQYSRFLDRIISAAPKKTK